jgi:hypothetical protein
VTRGDGIVLSRRELAGAALGAFVGPLPEARASRWELLGPERWPRTGSSGEMFALGLMESATGRYRRMPLPFEAHSIAVSPRDPDAIAVLPQRPGRRLALCSRRELAISAQVEATPGTYLYGHAVFSGDGSALICTAHDERTGGGLLEVRDARDGRLLERRTAHGIGPHDLALTADGGAVAVCNWGREHGERGSADSTVAWIDVASGRLLDETRPTEATAGFRHLCIGVDGTLVLAMELSTKSTLDACVAICRSRAARVATAAIEPALRAAPAVWRRISLSVATAGDDLAIVTHPEGHAVSFWDLRSATLRALLPVPAPQGVVAVPGAPHILLTTASGRIVAVDRKTLTQAPDPFPLVNGLNWRHARLAPLPS